MQTSGMVKRINLKIQEIEAWRKFIPIEENGFKATNLIPIFAIIGIFYLMSVIIFIGEIIFNVVRKRMPFVENKLFIPQAYKN